MWCMMSVFPPYQVGCTIFVPTILLWHWAQHILQQSRNTPVAQIESSCPTCHRHLSNMESHIFYRPIAIMLTNIIQKQMYASHLLSLTLSLTWDVTSPTEDCSWAQGILGKLLITMALTSFGHWVWSSSRMRMDYNYHLWSGAPSQFDQHLSNVMKPTGAQDSYTAFYTGMLHDLLLTCPQTRRYSAGGKKRSSLGMLGNLCSINISEILQRYYQQAPPLVWVPTRISLTPQ